MIVGLPSESRSYVRRGRSRLPLGAGALAILLFAFASAGIHGRSGPPSYKVASKTFAKLWKEKFPVKPVRILANPKKKGVLRVLHRRRYVYYFHFQVVLPRPTRDESGKVTRSGTRNAVVWLRYRRHIKKKPWDLTFAREDLLPGKYRRWFKRRR